METKRININFLHGAPLIESKDFGFIKEEFCECGLANEDDIYSSIHLCRFEYNDCSAQLELLVAIMKEVFNMEKSGFFYVKW